MKVNLQRMFLCLMAAVLMTAGAPWVGHAALSGVSSLDPAILSPTYGDIVAGDALSIPPAEVVTNIANGFPLWYEDNRGRKLELCLQQEVVRAADQTPFFPCLTAEPFPVRPIAFPSNFGNEGFYWGAIAADTYLSGANTLEDLLVVMAHEISFGDLLVVDGEQSVLSRIRVRANVPVAGTYRVTHPFGSFDYVVPVAGGGREINQTQDIGGEVLNFLASLADGPPPAPLVDPSIDQGVVNGDGASIGPYLGVGGQAPILDTDGHLYLADAGTELFPVFNPIEPHNGVDYFQLELLDPPLGFFLNAADSSQIVRLDNFQIIGKLFNDAPNLPPTAAADAATTSPGRAVLIDVVGNDLDLRSIDLTDPFNHSNPANSNVHGINDQAIGLVDGLGNIVRTEVLTTAAGASVRRVNDAATGRALFLYTPLSGAQAAGEDSFTYVVQDHGGLLSEPAQVTVLVENLGIDRVDYRVQTGKWEITGVSSDATDNSITLFAGPRALMSGDAEIPAVATEAIGLAAVRLTETSLAFRVDVAPLPVSEVEAIHVHLGNPGENGPVIFTLYDSLFDAALTGRIEGVLNQGSLESKPDAGVNTFEDAVQAILEGRTYVNLHTAQHPAGEIRGQISVPQIGVAEVAGDGSWQFSGRAEASPGLPGLASLSAVSANGNRILGVPLEFR